MPKRYSTDETISALKKAGFFLVSQKGSHIKLKNNLGYTVIVPANRKPLRIGTFKSILRQAKLSQKEFESL